MTITLRILEFGSADHAEAVQLRREILRAPLGLDFTPEQLAGEADDLHLAGFIDGRIVATVVLTPYDPVTCKLRQMAVAEDMRGSGIGAQMLKAAEDHALRLGFTRIQLAARLSAQAFYLRHGYVAQGEVYTEVTLPHITLTKDIGA